MVLKVYSLVAKSGFTLFESFWLEVPKIVESFKNQQQQLCFKVSQSATLVDGVHNCSHAVAVQCVLGNHSVLACMWMSLDMHRPPEPCHGNTSPWWQWLPPSITMCTAAQQTLFWNDPRGVTRSSRCQPGLQISPNDLSSAICMSWSCLVVCTVVHTAGNKGKIGFV